MAYKLQGVVSGKGVGPGHMKKSLRGLCVDKADQLYVVGDSEVKVFDAEGKLKRHWKTAKPALCVTVGDDGQVLVGEPGQVEKFDSAGKHQGFLRDGERLRLPTTVALGDKATLVGDALARAIYRYDQNGQFVNKIGADNRTKGFLIPNGHVDFVLDARGVIHAANPGKHRVERYSPTGELLGRFGKFTGPKPEGFSGCCNPTNLTLTAEGNVVVTVKAPPAVKVYDPEGKLLAVLGTDAFDPNCKNMDVAVDSRGRIYVADTVRLQICVFVAEKQAAKGDR